MEKYHCKWLNRDVNVCNIFVNGKGFENDLIEFIAPQQKMNPITVTGFCSKYQFAGMTSIEPLTASFEYTPELDDAITKGYERLMNVSWGTSVAYHDRYAQYTRDLYNETLTIQTHGFIVKCDFTGFRSNRRVGNLLEISFDCKSWHADGMFIEDNIVWL